MGKKRVPVELAGDMDQFPSEGKTPEEELILNRLEEEVRKVLQTLTPREEKILRMRFGIGEKTGDFPVTRERIRQIEANALRKLSRAKLPKK